MLNEFADARLKRAVICRRAAMAIAVKKDAPSVLLYKLAPMFAAVLAVVSLLELIIGHI